MSLAQWFGFKAGTMNGFTEELPEIFPIPIAQGLFIETDVVNIFAKILTDVLERTHGLSDDQVALLWDNCLMSSSNDGLVTMLSKAMAHRKELFIVYEKPPVNVIRSATSEEQVQIRKDYESQGESGVGVYISFKNYTRADMIKLYSALQYCTVGSLYKAMNLAKAVQFKMNDMRSSVGLVDSVTVIQQAMAIARALARGQDILLDGKDLIETASPELTAVNQAIDFINDKMSFYLGLPASYITGEVTSGLNSTGEGDQKAVERGLKNYFFSIIKPVLGAIFDVKVTYKSQDFRQVQGAMEVLKIFTLADESIVSLENKQKIMNQLLDLPEDATGDEPRPAPNPPPGAPVPPAPPAPRVVPTA